jgi:hypothetical protein
MWEDRGVLLNKVYSKLPGTMTKLVSKNVWTLPKSRMHIFNMSTTTAKFKECQRKGASWLHNVIVGTLYEDARHLAFKSDALCAIQLKIGFYFFFFISSSYGSLQFYRS